MNDILLPRFNYMVCDLVTARGQCPWLCQKHGGCVTSWQSCYFTRLGDRIKTDRIPLTPALARQLIRRAHAVLAESNSLDQRGLVTKPGDAPTPLRPLSINSGARPDLHAALLAQDKKRKEVNHALPHLPH